MHSAICAFVKSEIEDNEASACPGFDHSLQFIRTGESRILPFSAIHKDWPFSRVGVLGHRDGGGVPGSCDSDVFHDGVDGQFTDTQHGV
jgi:hypothetical protein